MPPTTSIDLRNREADSRYDGLPENFYDRNLRRVPVPEEEEDFARGADATTLKVSRWLSSNAAFSRSFGGEEDATSDGSSESEVGDQRLAQAFRSVRHLLRDNHHPDKVLLDANPSYAHLLKEASSSSSAQDQPSRTVLQELEKKLQFRVLGSTASNEKQQLREAGFDDVDVASGLGTVTGAARKRKEGGEDGREEEEKRRKEG